MMWNTRRFENPTYQKGPFSSTIMKWKQNKFIEMNVMMYPSDRMIRTYHWKDYTLVDSLGGSNVPLVLCISSEFDESQLLMHNIYTVYLAMDNYTAFKNVIEAEVQRWEDDLRKDEMCLNTIARGMGAAMSRMNMANRFKEVRSELDTLTLPKLYELVVSKAPTERFASFNRQRIALHKQKVKEQSNDVVRHWILNFVGGWDVGGIVTKHHSDPKSEVNFRIVCEQTVGNYHSNAVGIVLVYNATNVKSFADLPYKLKAAMNKTTKPKECVALVVIGFYPSDEMEVTVTESRGMEYADDIGALWIKTKKLDLKSSEIKRMFRILATRLWRWYPLQQAQK
eukprot:TRINITY_DN3038_c0_g1_i1.p1 TRINITY_DN3038_c0_g1~~TRINITY_DN3038_c0_g1_i1.p1  ORF type:complete len:339 (+),score=42.84 TRINITY_DN3038_c0_g1_i1:301-1317(+)